MLDAETVSAATKTTCPYCGVGCGVIAKLTAAGEVEISGDPEHPANRGRLCSKGLALGETTGLEGRLLYPQVRNRQASWDEALEHVASELSRIIATHGPESVALYVSGQLLTEDYYVANKFMKGGIGTANIDTNSRLCMSSAVAGHKRAFGEDLVPVSYDDLESAELIVLVGSNTAWCHPVLFQRILQARADHPGRKLVVVDPRRTPTCEFADLHLPVRAGTDVHLFNGLLNYLSAVGCMDQEFVGTNTTGVEAALSVASSASLEQTSADCGLTQETLADFYAMFAAHERTITLFSQGVNQSSSGTDKVNAIINCHLLTGRIGRQGMGPFSVTGQPNAMGGREVGGLANTLAAHLDLENAEHRTLVQQFWGSPRIASRAGLKAVELFDAIHAGTVKAVWIIATNPVVSLPDADKVRRALKQCELVIVSDCMARTDTTALAHVLLPAAAWGEKEGTVTNSERRISRQRSFLPVPGEARPDWWTICEVARRMGLARGFQFDTAHEIFSEHAALSSMGNQGTRAFDIGGLARLDPHEYDTMRPIQWPVPEQGTGTRLFADRRFYHPDGKARFVAVQPSLPRHLPDAQFPFVLNTGRIRDQWHTMTRSGKAPRLTRHLSEPFVDVHAADALQLGLRVGELAMVATKWGELVVRVRSSGEIARGQLFVPIHWSAGNASNARVGALVNPVVDAVSGEPEFKHTPARIEPFSVATHAFAISREPLDVDTTWWNVSQARDCLVYGIADRAADRSAERWRKLIGADAESEELLEYRDDSVGLYRAAIVREDRLEACVFVSPQPNLPASNWLTSLFGQRRLTDAQRASLLLGRMLNEPSDEGAIVCSCFGVGRETIVTAIRKQSLRSVAAVGQRLRAGTNCGSCVAEIRLLLAATVAE